MTIDEAIAHAQETADTRSDLCDECREEHRQLADWLTELKQLREETSKLKRLLRLAMEDIRTLLVCDCVPKICAEQACNCSTTAQCKCICKWKHAEEALKLLGDDKQ